VATLHVRQVPDELYELLRRRAESNGRSIGAEATFLLVQQLGGDLQLPARSLGRRRRQRREGLFTRFTQQARAAVVNAQEEARARQHEAIGSEHLLLGVLRTETSAGANALRALGLELGAARAEVDRLLGRGAQPSPRALPFTPTAKKALELALREALAYDCDYIGTEHLALGILRVGAGNGRDLILAAEPDEERVRRSLVSAVASPPPAVPERFRVLELDGDAGEWEALLNEQSAGGYELVEIVDRRAIFRRA